jgi:hypothetical protein
MSTATQESSFLRSSPSYDDQPTRRFSFNATVGGVDEATESLIRYASAIQKISHSQHKQQSRVLRRLSGFLTEINGKNARVTFVENGGTFQYDLPVERLSKCGIEMVNQPFEMDEVELQTDEGLVVGYRFRPLAKASDAYRETLNFDEERKRKRDLILKKFAKAKA